MKLLILATTIMMLTSCLESGSGSAAISTNPTNGAIVGFNPDDLTSFTGTWVDQANANRGFVVDANGTASGTITAAWVGLGGGDIDCTFSGMLANTLTVLGNDSYRIDIYVASGVVNNNIAYCPSASYAVYPQTKSVTFLRQQDGCILVSDGLGLNKTYCKQ